MAFWLLCKPAEEFTCGAELYVGGFEAAQAFCIRRLRAQDTVVDVIVDCREGYGIGHGQDWRPDAHRLGEAYLWFPVNEWLEGRRAFTNHSFGKHVRMLLGALAAGKRVLLFCKNGKHRSES